MLMRMGNQRKGREAVGPTNHEQGERGNAVINRLRDVFARARIPSKKHATEQPANVRPSGALTREICRGKKEKGISVCFKGESNEWFDGESLDACFARGHARLFVRWVGSGSERASERAMWRIWGQT